jgi:hypothetical protein
VISPVAQIAGTFGRIAGATIVTRTFFQDLVTLGLVVTYRPIPGLTPGSASAPTSIIQIAIADLPNMLFMAHHLWCLQFRAPNFHSRRSVSSLPRTHACAPLRRDAS